MNPGKNYFPRYNLAKIGSNPPKEAQSSKKKVIIKNVVLEPNYRYSQEKTSIDDESQIIQSKKSNEQQASRDHTPPFTNPKSYKNLKQTKFAHDNDASEDIMNAYYWYKGGKRLRNDQTSSLRNVANYFGVKTSTLATRTSGQVSISDPPHIRRKLIFTKSELQEIVNHLLAMADLGYGSTKRQAENLIRYLTIFKTEKKARDFKASHGFVCRLFCNPELTKRHAQSFDYLRAARLTPDLIKKFFVILEDAYKLPKQLTSFEIEPKSIWSMNEVGFSYQKVQITALSHKKEFLM